MSQPFLPTAPDTLITDHADDLVSTATATFSPCRNYRYALTRRWDNNPECIAFVMLNPSTADAFDVDPTIRRCLGFARSWGYGALLVLNLFALRSTDPKALYGHPDPAGPDNDTVIAGRAAQMAGPVVAAWGVHGTHLSRDRLVLGNLRAHGARVVSLGVTKDGHPRHPLYVRGDTPLTDFPGGAR